MSATGDTLECVTGRRGPILRHNSVPITLTVHDTGIGRGIAVVNETVRFRYLDAWSAVNTWLNDEPPLPGDSVVIPIDQTILLDTDASLFLLLVQGALVFDRRDINLDASYIFVQVRMSACIIVLPPLEHVCYTMPPRGLIGPKWPSAGPCSCIMYLVYTNESEFLPFEYLGAVWTPSVELFYNNYTIVHFNASCIYSESEFLPFKHLGVKIMSMSPRFVNINTPSVSC